DLKAGCLVGIVDGDARSGVGNCRYISNRSVAAIRIRLPAGLGDEFTATTASTSPGRLCPTAAATAHGQVGSADSSQRIEVGRGARAEAAVSRTRRDSNTRMVIVFRLEFDILLGLRAAIAIADRVSS